MDFKELEDFTNSWWPISISFVVSAIIAIRMYAGGAKCPNETRLDGKLAIVTGGASGIGLSTATELAKRGAHVILACRDAQKGLAAVEAIGRRAPAASVEARALDVASLASIRRFSADVLAERPRVDILINNAAVIDERLERTFATNYLGPFLLAHLLLPALERAPDGGRVVNVCAAAHKLTTTLAVDNVDFSREFVGATAAFGHTKLALMLFTRHFARLLRRAGRRVTANAVDPGLVRGTGHHLSDSWMAWLFLKSPKQGCQSALYVATDRAFEQRTGDYIADCESTPPNELAHDRALLAALYARSCELAGIEPLSE